MKNDIFVSENTFFLRIICFDITIPHMFYNLIAEYEIDRLSMVRELQAIIDSEYLIPDSGYRCNSIEAEKIVITSNVHSPCTTIAKSDEVKYGHSAATTVIQDAQLFLLYAERPAPVVQFLEKNT